MALKRAFQERYRNILEVSGDMERFLKEEMFAVQALFLKQSDRENGEKGTPEQGRQKQSPTRQPDFADRELKTLTDRIHAYPPLNFHEDASDEIIHLYGAIREFEGNHWPQLDRFINEDRSRERRGEDKDYNNLISRFTPTGEGNIPPS